MEYFSSLLIPAVLLLTAIPMFSSQHNRFALFTEGAKEEHPLLSRCYTQLCEYLKGERREFDLPLAPEGTGFQKKVWQALSRIPYGETRSYGEIAVEIGNPDASRAVGMANHRNPLPILIPCHRVIGKNGALTGYAGGLKCKKILLELEENNR